MAEIPEQPFLPGVPARKVRERRPRGRRVRRVSTNPQVFLRVRGITRELDEALQAAAKKQGLGRDELIVRLLKGYLERRASPELM